MRQEMQGEKGNLMMPPLCWGHAGGYFSVISDPGKMLD